MSSFGRYEPIGELASGGMGSVYLARAVGEGGFERLVALKVMHPHLAKDEKFRHMFLDEARLAARVRHPNVVSTIDVQRNADGIFLVMDYVEGPSLYALRRHYSAHQQTIPLPEILRILLDALAGLQAAHDLCDDDGAPLDLVHRDVTPQNILVGKDGIARITDFGVARAASRLVTTQTGQIKGKIPYMAPEQLAAEPVDPRTDLYAVGVTLWESLSGQRLFAADNHAALIAKVVKGVQTRPSELNADVPAPIEDVCMRALSMSREARPANATALAEQIELAAKQANVRIATTKELSTFVRAHSFLWQTPGEIRESHSELIPVRPPAQSNTPQLEAAQGTVIGTAHTPAITIVMPPRKRLLLVAITACAIGGAFGVWASDTSSPTRNSTTSLVRDKPANASATPAPPTSASSSATSIASAAASTNTAPAPTASASSIANAKPSATTKPPPRRRWPPPRRKTTKPRKRGSGSTFRPSGL